MARRCTGRNGDVPEEIVEMKPGPLTEAYRAEKRARRGRRKPRGEGRRKRKENKAEVIFIIRYFWEKKTMDKIKIRTGANISNILQSTITYAQAFTELAKNSIQNGATNINIQLTKESIVFQDNGVGFDDSIDTNGLSGFDKYFVFGNSYDFGGGAGPRLGHMGIGGKIANDKLSDSDNVHWTIETKNKKGNSYLVTYKPNNSEFLDDYSPTIEKLSNSRLVKSGTIITIKNLDKPIAENGLNRESVEKELQDFFGHLIKNGKTEIDIILNGDSIKFDYTLSGYAFEKMTEQFFLQFK